MIEVNLNVGNIVYYSDLQDGDSDGAEDEGDEDDDGSNYLPMEYLVAKNRQSSISVGMASCSLTNIIWYIILEA